MEEVTQQIDYHRTKERLEPLIEAVKDGHGLSPSQRFLIYKIEKQLTEIMSKIEKRCSCKGMSLSKWTPNMKEAGMKLSYWERRSKTDNYQNDKNSTNLELRCGKHPDTFKKLFLKQECLERRKEVRKVYYKLRNDQTKNRENYLDKIAEAYAELDGKKKATDIKRIRVCK